MEDAETCNVLSWLRSVPSPIVLSSDVGDAGSQDLSAQRPPMFAQIRPTYPPASTRIALMVDPDARYSGNNIDWHQFVYGWLDGGSSSSKAYEDVSMASFDSSDDEKAADLDEQVDVVVGENSESDTALRTLIEYFGRLKESSADTGDGLHKVALFMETPTFHERVTSWFLDPQAVDDEGGLDQKVDLMEVKFADIVSPNSSESPDDGEVSNLDEEIDSTDEENPEGDTVLRTLVEFFGRLKESSTDPNDGLQKLALFMESPTFYVTVKNWFLDQQEPTPDDEGSGDLPVDSMDVEDKDLHLDHVSLDHRHHETNDKQGVIGGMLSEFEQRMKATLLNLSNSIDQKVEECSAKEAEIQVMRKGIDDMREEFSKVENMLGEMCRNFIRSLGHVNGSNDDN